MTKPVEEKELSDAAVATKLLVRPNFEFGEAERLSFFGKVKLAEKPIDPNIHGKGVPAPIGIQKDAA